MSRQDVPARVEKMVPYKPGKPLEELERELGITGAIKVASNENPLGPSPEVIAEVEAAARDLGFYPDGAQHALRADLATHFGIGLDEVVVGNGSNELIDLICKTFADAGDHVVFGNPSFVCYELGCISCALDYTAVPLTNHVTWDIPAMIDAVRPETKLFFLANPNNPTGAHVTRADLQRVLSEVPEHVLVVLDEAYVEFADADDYVSALELRQMRERLIVLRTFSKAYGLAALRVGYAIGPASEIGYLHRMRAPFNVNLVGQRAARVALRDESGHMKRYIEMNRSERARVAAGFSELGLEVAPSQTNFILVNVDRPGTEIYDKMLRDGVIVRPMPAPISTWLRISIGTPEMNDRMLRSIASALR